MGCSLFAVCWLSCPMTCGILVPWLGIEPLSPALEGRFLTTGPPGKSQEVTFGIFNLLDDRGKKQSYMWHLRHCCSFAYLEKYIPGSPCHLEGTSFFYLIHWEIVPCYFPFKPGVSVSVVLRWVWVLESSEYDSNDKESIRCYMQIFSCLAHCGMKLLRPKGTSFSRRKDLLSYEIDQLWPIVVPVACISANPGAITAVSLVDSGPPPSLLGLRPQIFVEDLSLYHFWDRRLYTS